MNKSLQKKVEDTIRRNLTSAQVDSVHIQSDFDADGEAIFSIVVVIENTVPRVNARELLGLTRHVRSTLHEDDEQKFPIVTVMNLRDWIKQINEAA